jgi:hypothetical protein
VDSTFALLRRARGVPVLDGTGALLAAGLPAATRRAAAGCSVRRAAPSQRSDGFIAGADVTNSFPSRDRLTRRLGPGPAHKPITTTGDSKLDGFADESRMDVGGPGLITRTGAFTSAPSPVGPDAPSSVASTVSAGAGPGKPG